MAPCYRLVVIEKVATWTEVSERMSIDDVDCMCILLDTLARARAEGEVTQ